MIYFQFNLYLIIILSITLPIINALKCYQCSTNDKRACDDSYLKECPTDQAYDECSITYKKLAGNFQVIRKCVLGPCSLKNRDIPLSEKCDMSQNEYNCIHCCKEDGCNKDSVNTISPNKWLLFTFLLITIIYNGLSHFKLFC